MKSSTLASLTALAATTSAWKMNACYDGNCQNCTQTDYLLNPAGYPAVQWYSNFSMAQYPQDSGSGGYEVYWNIEQPDPSCSVFITRPFLETHSTVNSGNVILQTSDAGCFRGALSQPNFAVGYCCGDGDCGAAIPGYGGGAAAKKRDGLENGLEVRSEAQSSPVLGGNSGAKVFNSRIRRDLKSGNALAETLQRRDAPVDWCANTEGYFTCLNEPWAPNVDCGVPKVVDSYSKAGIQEPITGPSNCDPGDNACSITILKSKTVASTLTNEHSFTHTEGGSYSATLSAGLSIEGVGNIGGSATFEHNFSNAVEKSSSYASTNTLQMSTSWSYQQAPGSTGVLTFTPTLDCKLLQMSCNGQAVTVEKCVPTKDSTGHAEGEMLYMNIGTK